MWLIVELIGFGLLLGLAWLVKIFLQEESAGRRMLTLPRIPRSPPLPYILGNLLDMDQVCYEEGYQRMYDKLGTDILLYRMPFFFPNGHLVVFRDPKLIPEIALTPSRPKGPSYDWMARGFGENILVDTATWKKRRTLLNAGFHNDMLRIYLDTIVRVTVRAMNEFLPASASKKYPFADYFSSYRFSTNSQIPKTELDKITNSVETAALSTNSGGVLVEADEWATNLTFFIILAAVFGDDLELVDVPELLNDIAYLVGKLSQYMLHHPEGLLPKPRFYNAKKRIIETIKRVMKVRRERGSSQNDRSEDILAIMMRSASSSSTNSNKDSASPADQLNLTDDDLCSDILALIFAGHDTTAHSIAWALYELTQSESVFAKLKEEVESLGIFDDDPSNRVPHLSFDDLNRKLKYMNLFIREVLRLHPPAGSIVRHVHEDTVFAGHPVAKDTALSYSIYCGCRNPKIWGPTANDFDPERFLPDRLTDDQQAAAIPFSVGPRNCVGQPLALLELKVVLALVVAYDCKWRVAETRRDPSTNKFKVDKLAVVTLRAKDGMPLIFNCQA